MSAVVKVGKAVLAVVGRIFQTYSLPNSARLIFFSLICTLCCDVATGQSEVQFSGGFQIPTSCNPGASGHSGDIDVTAAHRQQWVGFADAPKEFLVGVDAEVGFLGNFHGVGVIAIQDQSGGVTTLDLGANYSYHIYLGKGLLGLGARLGVRNVKLEGSDLKTTVEDLTDDYHQDNDPVLSSLDDSQTSFDVGLGGFFQTEESYVGWSMLHLTAPELEFKNGALFKVRPVMSVTAGRMLGKDIRVRAFEPRLSMRTDFVSFQMEMSVNVDIRQRVWFGLGCRLQDAMLVGLGVRLKNGLDIAYTYDMSLSKLKRYNSGSHEIAVNYTFDLDFSKATKRYKSVRIL